MRVCGTPGAEFLFAGETANIFSGSVSLTRFSSLIHIGSIYLPAYEIDRYGKCEYMPELEDIGRTVLAK